MKSGGEGGVWTYYPCTKSIRYVTERRLDINGDEIEDGFDRLYCDDEPKGLYPFIRWGGRKIYLDNGGLGLFRIFRDASHPELLEISVNGHRIGNSFKLPNGHGQGTAHIFGFTFQFGEEGKLVDSAVLYVQRQETTPTKPPISLAHLKSKTKR